MNTGKFKLKKKNHIELPTLHLFALAWFEVRIVETHVRYNSTQSLMNMKEKLFKQLKKIGLH